MAGQNPLEGETARALHPSSDHEAMTLAAVEALSPAELEYLELERELLITTYCEFPDANWTCYGEWGGWSGYPNEPRLPDVRREWNISFYCGYDPATGKGRFYSHSAPDSYEACPLYFMRAVEALRAGRHAEGIRILGVLAHYAEDSVTFPHMQAIHRRMGFDFDRVNLGGYEPQVLGETLEEAAANLRKRLERAVAFTEERALAIRAALKDNDSPRLEELFVECDNEGARVVADVLRTAIRLAGPKPPVEPNPVGVNLLENPSFEADDGSGVPVGWVVGWHNLRDKLGRAEWEGRISRNARVTHTGRHAVKLMWTPPEGLEWRQRWPSAFSVRPGERYRCSGWVKTQEATGESYLILYLYRRNLEPVASFRSEPVAGTQDWRRLVFVASIPEGAEKARLACRADGNGGAVWFDDVEVVRVGETAPTDVPPAEKVREEKPSLPSTDDLVLFLRFEEAGARVQDASLYRRLNGPIVCLSGGHRANLHTPEGRIGQGLRLDGEDDFVEVPRWKLNDVLHPHEELTLMLWVYADEPRDAYLLAKERVEGERYAGYRLEITREGRVRFLVAIAGEGEPYPTAPFPTGEWVLVAATLDRQGRQRLFINGELKAEVQRPADGVPTPCDRDFYLGANFGVEAFFRGRLDEVRLYNRALTPEEIAATAAQSSSPVSPSGPT